MTKLISFMVAVVAMAVLVELGVGLPWLRSEEEMRDIFEAWKVTHGKEYGWAEEEAWRYEIFKENLRFIDEHNRPENGHTYKVGLNHFADLTELEFLRMYLGRKNVTEEKAHVKKAGSDRYRYEVGEKLPGMVDWRREGAVAAVKDQGPCGEVSNWF